MSFWYFQGYHTRSHGSLMSTTPWISLIRKKGIPWEGDRVPYEMCLVPGFFYLIRTQRYPCMFTYCYCFDCPWTFNCQSFIVNLVSHVSFAVTFCPDKNRSKSTCGWENRLQYFTSSVISSLPSLFISVFQQHFHSFSFLYSFMAYPGKMK